VGQFLVVINSADTDIVGSWFYQNNDVPMHTVLTFLGDGRYMQASVIAGDDAHTGIEWGTYGWNALTGLVSPVAQIDTNGDWGVSNNVDGDLYFSVNGNIGTYSRPGDPNVPDSAFSVTLNRITRGTTPIVGSWLLDHTDQDGSAFIVATFLNDGRYLDASVIADDAEHTGIEWGTYSWNSVTGEVFATSHGDRNGDWGFAGDVDGNQFILVDGNSARLFQPGCADCGGDLNRVIPASLAQIGSVVPNFLAGSGNGELSTIYSVLDSSGIAALVSQGIFSAPNFLIPGTVTQLFDVNYSGTFDGAIELSFNYDPTLLPDGFDEANLRVFHWTGTEWESLGGVVDSANNTITVTTSSLSPFAVAAVPEPETYALMLAGLGLVGFAARRRKEA
jgi:hypothetical protein